MSSSSAMNLCFNSNCKQPLNQNPKMFGAELPRRGWRRRSGDFADLCDRCASAYEEGKFCETFHLNASGWRCCESCGKQIHCGCIVSFHMFVLLDAGGIECMTCARKSFILTPNPAWPPSPSFMPSHSERTNDLSGKNWCHIAGSGPVPWRQAPSFFGSSCARPSLQSRMPMEVDVTGGFQRLTFGEGLSVASFDKKKVDVSERLVNGSLKLGLSEKHDSGNNYAEQANLRVNIQQQPSFLKKDTPHINFPLYSATRNEIKDSTVVSCTHVPQPIPPHVNGKHCSGQCGTESSGVVLTHNGRPSGDTRLPNQSFPRCWPNTSNHELQQIPGTSKIVTTPLFEKILSVSDAGNLGRLILPKKCAEAYFPPISEPEGLSLKVQDLKGKEWTFQFRFWPNNNSRMYVLEGVYPCMQSMNLQAGDVVTFNRIEPEGKLVMGFRKSTALPSNQEAGFGNTSIGSSKGGDDSAKKSKHGEGVSKCLGSVRKPSLVDQASPWCKDKKAEFTAKEVIGAKSTMSNKRKSSILGPKSKGLRIEKDDLIKLELTLEQAQGLFRAPLNRIPHVVVIEGFEFEEYEQDAPVIGRPTIITIDSMGENVQWAQCEDCLKWRKVPGDASLPARWTCSGNSWDPERSSCSTAQELTPEQLEELLSRSKQTARKNTNAVKQEPDSFVDEGNVDLSSSQSTIKHPRHRPGCTCIVCIQPPRGESPRHIQTCTCNVCLSTKRRLQTLMSKREQKQSEKEAEISAQKLPDHQSSPKQVSDEKKQACVVDIGSSSLDPNTGNDKDDVFNTKRSPLSPFKGLIDLNSQPERDEEQSPRSDSGGLTKLIHEIHSSGDFRNGNGRENGNIFVINHRDSEAAVPLQTPDNNPESTLATQR